MRLAQLSRRILARHGKLLRYGVVQGGSVSLDYFTYTFLIYEWGALPIPASIAGRLVAGVTAFILHRVFTFKVVGQGAGSQRRQAVLWFSLLALNLPLSSALLVLALQVTDNKLVAKIISDTLCILLNYWLSHKFVFTTAPAAANQTPDNV